MASWTNLIEDLFSRITETGSTLLAVTDNKEQTLIDKCELLLSSEGEATGLARSRDIVTDYNALSRNGKLEFFLYVCQHFGVNIEALNKALKLWQETPNEGNARDIHFTSEPRTQELIRRLNRAPGGTVALVKMREDLIAFIKQNPELRLLDQDFQHLFGSWFNRGFLSLQSINWSTSAKILEKIIEYEAVHEIQGWDDLRHRVAVKDRKLFAFFHPSLPEDPLIFVEVALTDALPDSITTILDGERPALDPKEASTAVFYSISNCQMGLRGISFGNFLIKQVVEELKRNHPSLKRFVTMSPVPGLRRWFESREDLDVTTDTLVKALNSLNGLPTSEFIDANKDALLNLATAYLLDAKNNKGGPYDPVSRFHLGNGARLEQINLWADQSDRGLADSWGIMVNYEYDLTSIEQNHEAFLSEGAIMTSSAIKRHYKNN